MEPWVAYDGIRERHIRDVYNAMSDERRIWVDQDTVVYLLSVGAHLRKDEPPKEWVVVVSHIPSKTGINYDRQGTEIAKSVPHGGSLVVHQRLITDSAVRSAVETLRGRIQ